MSFLIYLFLKISVFKLFIHQIFVFIRPVKGIPLYAAVVLPSFS